MTFANVNLDEDEDMAPAEEDEDEDEEGDSGEFIDLLDVLDGKATTDDDEKLPKSKGPEDEAEVRNGKKTTKMHLLLLTMKTYQRHLMNFKNSLQVSTPLPKSAKQTKLMANLQRLFYHGKNV